MVSFVSQDYIFILMLTKEFGFSDGGAGRMYSLIALATFFYGLFISGFIMDRYGVRTALILGSFALTVSRFLTAVIVD